MPQHAARQVSALQISPIGAGVGLVHALGIPHWFTFPAPFHESRLCAVPPWRLDSRRASLFLLPGLSTRTATITGIARAVTAVHWTAQTEHRAVTIDPTGKGNRYGARVHRTLIPRRTRP